MKTAILVVAVSISLLAACKPKPNSAIASATEAPRALYLLRDTGKRCITHPCPSWAAVDVETRRETEITGIDLSALGLDAKKAEDARSRVLTGQVRVRGEIKKVPKAGPAGDGTVLAIDALVDPP